MRKVNLTGKKFGSWKVLGYQGMKHGESLWRCRCVCGKTRHILSSRLTHGYSTQCQSCASRNMEHCGGSEHSRWKGFGKIPNWYWLRLLRGAQQRGLVFDITIEYGYELLLNQHFYCALSGQKLWLSQKVTTSKNTTASLDRIDSKKGYIVGNVQWVHKDINNMKQAFSQSYFIDMCKRIASHCDNDYCWYNNNNPYDC